MKQQEQQPSATPPQFASTQDAAAAVSSATRGGSATSAVQGSTTVGAAAAAIQQAAMSIPGQGQQPDKRTPSFVPRPSAQSGEQGPAAAAPPSVATPALAKYFRDGFRLLRATPPPVLPFPEGDAVQAEDRPRKTPLGPVEALSIPAGAAPSPSRAPAGVAESSLGPAMGGPSRHPALQSATIAGQRAELADRHSIARRRALVREVAAGAADRMRSDLIREAEACDRAASVSGISRARAARKRRRAQYLRRLARRAADRADCQNRDASRWKQHSDAALKRLGRLGEHSDPSGAYEGR